MLVAVYKRVEGLRTIFINLIFLDMEKMKSDVIWVWSNGCCEEAYVELYFGAFQEWQREPKHLSSDAQENHLISNHIFIILFQKFQNIYVIKQDGRIQIIIIKSLILDENRDKVAQSDYGHLVLVYLCLLYLNELVHAIVFY